MLQIVGLYLDSPDGPLTGVHIRRVVHVRAVSGLQLRQHLCQFCERLSFETVAQSLILRHRRELVAFEHRLDIESRSATEDGHRPFTYYIIIGIEEFLLILKQVVLRSRLADVDQVIGNLAAVNGIILQILSRSDIHPPIHLSGIGRDNLSANLCSQSCCHRRLPRGRRT